MKRHFITLGCLGCALVFYFVGFILPATMLLVLGMLAELMFWLRVFFSKRG
ncbi:MAG: hypothetical protein ACO22K_10715 [Woeseiaceae bacterium]|jgi:hypothetical protein